MVLAYPGDDANWENFICICLASYGQFLLRMFNADLGYANASLMLVVEATMLTSSFFLLVFC